MKTRLGFISNSSSASFVIDARTLSKKRRKLLFKLPFGTEGLYDWWTIKQDGHLIKGWTVMDNGDLAEYLQKNYNWNIAPYIIDQG